MLRAQQRLMIVVPITLLIIILIIYLNTRSLVETLIIMLSVPLALVGSFWMPPTPLLATRARQDTRLSRGGSFDLLYNFSIN